MGGFGSGRRAGTGRRTVESCRWLDVNHLRRTGALAPGWRGALHWLTDGERVASLELRAEPGGVVLSYRARFAGAAWQNIEERVPLVQVPCPFGGNRPYFVCPGANCGKKCGRRVGRLYGAGLYFLCRHCYRLAYASQREDAIARTLRRANKIRRRLGGSPELGAELPARPKRMWRRTYARLQDQILKIESSAEAALDSRAEQLLARIALAERKRSFWP